MNADQRQAAQKCLTGSEANTMTFPQIIGTLLSHGFESYAVDYRKAMATYYLANGQSIDLPTHREDVAIAEVFDVGALKACIKDAQTLAPGYSYMGFCRKVMAAGCAGYVVSFIGKRAVYFGRTAETHTEHFPQ